MSLSPRLLSSLIILMLLLTGCREPVLHDLSESNANRGLVRLRAAGLDASKLRQPDGDWLLQVESARVTAAAEILQSMRLSKSSGGIAMEGASLLAGRDERRIQLQMLRAREIEETLESLDGALEARVHLNTPQSTTRLEGEHAERATAGVLLIVEPDFNSTPEEIARLVGGSTGCPAEAVSVILKPVTPPPRPVAALPASSWWWAEAGAGSFSGRLLALSVVLMAMGAGLIFVSLRKTISRRALAGIDVE